MASEMEIDVAASTNAGLHRKTNADAVLVDKASGIVAVADGVGDTPRAGAAARMALDAVHEMFLAPWCQIPPGERSTREAAERLVLGVMQAHGRLYVEGRPAGRRLGTTFAGAIICRDHLCIGSVGDSRVYLFRPNAARMQRLTEDHTLLSRAVRHGVPYHVAASQPDAHALTRAVGISRVLKLRPALTRWAPGDVVLACTDGLTDWLDDAAITRTLAACDAMEAVADRLVRQALAAGGQDNATAVLARWVV